MLLRLSRLSIGLAAAAAGLAVLDILETQALQANARDTGAYLLNGLATLSANHDRVGDVRGAGLYVALEFVRSRQSQAPDQDAATFAVNALRERGILIGTAGLNGNVLKIRPPLSFSGDHADMLIEAMKAVLGELA